MRLPKSGAPPVKIASLFGGLLVAISGCVHRQPPPPALVAAPHYVLGAPYQAGGHWFYPTESFGLDETGIAAMLGASAGLTADGELRDARLATAAMQTIQLPAIVSVTNLANGRQILVRVNDRGPASPTRIIALSPRAAQLLAITAGAVPVRVTIDEALTRRLADQLGGGPKLQIAAAPSAGVTAAALGPPGSASGPPRMLGVAAPQAESPRVPDRLPERIIQTSVGASLLMLKCGSFGRFTYANQVAARLSGLGADVVTSRDGRQTTYAVQAGPFATIAQADAALAEALRAGVIDARIAVQ